MTAPTFSAKGTAAGGNTDPCTGIANPQPTYPTLSSGDLIILAVTANAITGSIDVISPPSGFSIIDETGGGTSRMYGTYYKVASGSESGAVETTLTISGTTSSGRTLAQFYRIINNATSSVLDGTVGTATGTAATSIGMPTAPGGGTTSAANQLAVAVVYLSTNTTIGSSAGESGGDWTEAAAEDGAVTGTIQMQTAALASSGAQITGGNATSGASTTYRTVGFVVKELTAAASGRSVALNINQAVNRSYTY